MDEYNENLVTFFNTKEKILDPNKKTKNISYKETKDNTLTAVIGKNKKVSFKLPIYISVDEQLEKITEEIFKLNNDYIVLKNRILYNEDKLEDQKLEREYNIIVKNLNELNNQKEELIKSRNEQEQVKIIEKINKFQNELEDINTQKKDILRQINTDTTLNSNDLVKLIRKFIELNQDKRMKKIHDEIKNLKSYPRTFMKKVKDFDLSPEEKTEILPIEPKKEKVEKKEEIKPEPVVEVKEEVKQQIIETFPFKSVGECNTKKRTEPFFITKENLIKIIERNPKILEKMPKNYKKLSKEQLCSNLNLPIN